MSNKAEEKRALKPTRASCSKTSFIAAGNDLPTIKISAEESEESGLQITGQDTKEIYALFKQLPNVDMAGRQVTLLERRFKH